jgi:hypothetical protein
MKTKKQLLIFLISSLFGGNLIGQNSINSTGGNASGAGGTVSYSVGQIDFNAQTGTNGSINQGVQHPLEFYPLSLQENTIDFSVILYPNPTVAELYVDLIDVTYDNVFYTLTDASGKIIETKEIQNSQFSISLNELNRANYFLSFIRDGKVLNSYQIIKN